VFFQQPGAQVTMRISPSRVATIPLSGSVPIRTAKSI
jgi:hypothetical protein